MGIISWNLRPRTYIPHLQPHFLRQATDLRSLHVELEGGAASATGIRSINRIWSSTRISISPLLAYCELRASILLALATVVGGSALYLFWHASRGQETAVSMKGPIFRLKKLHFSIFCEVLPE